MEELGNEDVDVEDIRDVLFLHVPQNVDKPLKTLVARTNP